MMAVNNPFVVAHSPHRTASGDHGFEIPLKVADLIINDLQSDRRLDKNKSTNTDGVHPQTRAPGSQGKAQRPRRRKTAGGIRRQEGRLDVRDD
jgi:hypothetical protein